MTDVPTQPLTPDGRHPWSVPDGSSPDGTAADDVATGHPSIDETDAPVGPDDDGVFWGQADDRSRAARRGRWRRGIAEGWNRLLGMSVEGYITLFVVGVCAVFVFVQLHPQLLFSDTTPAGGDMGAHVWAPAYLRDHLLSKGRLTGWTPDWYAGFPAFQFYMIVPSLMIALLSYVIPYGVAFKLVAVSGCVSMPFSAYFFGRMARLPFPAPAVMSCGALLFLFDRSFSIYGGNIASTLAGEFAFSISLSLGLLYLGVLARGLETGRYRGWAAVLLALTGLCHLIPFLFVLVATVVLIVLRPGRAQFFYGLTMGVVGVALTAFWSLPFFGRGGYMNDMGWEKITGTTRYVNYLWDRTTLDAQLSNVPDLRWVIAVSAVGLLLSIVFRRRLGIFFAVMAAIFATGFVVVPQGALWNARLLPFYYLCLYLLAAIGVAEVGRLLSLLFARNINRPVRVVAWFTPLAALAAVVTMLAMSLRVMPGGRTEDGVYKWGVGPFALSTTDRSFIDSWADWNFTGYEGITTLANGQETYRKSYPEYEALMATMKGLGQQRGCGRAMWEHEDQHDRYGTPMALMLLPFWTDGCIGSMEGLYFEASATTPYHFLDQDELSWAPSNAQRGLPYTPGPPTQTDFDLGVRHLQMLGVKYYMAINDNTKALAARNTSLSTLETSGPWTVYAVADAPLVQGLADQPAVLAGQATTGNSWKDVAVCWYTNPGDWDVVLTADGPDSWQRVTRTVQPGPDATPSSKCQPTSDWGWFDTTGGPTATAQPQVKVSNIQETDDGVSFDVDQTGVPVLVKTSYFPNWQVSGADGPYRAVPNLMVVVPNGNHVELHYGYTGLDYESYAITLAAMAGLFALFKIRPVRVRPPRRFWGRAERPDLYPQVLPFRSVAQLDVPPFVDEPAPAGPPEPDEEYRHQWTSALEGIVPDLGPPPPADPPPLDRDPERPPDAPPQAPPGDDEFS